METHAEWLEKINKILVYQSHIRSTCPELLQLNPRRLHSGTPSRKSEKVSCSFSVQNEVVKRHSSEASRINLVCMKVISVFSLIMNPPNFLVNWKLSISSFSVLGLAVHHTLHETSLSKIPYYQLHLPTTSLLLPHRVIHTELSAYN